MEITKKTELQRDKLIVAFIDFRVLLNRMYGKIQIYFERKSITLKEIHKRIKKGESIEMEPEILADISLIKLATQIENSIETYEIPEKSDQLIQDFLELRLALSGFYPDILSKKIKTGNKRTFRKRKLEKEIKKLLKNSS